MVKTYLRYVSKSTFGVINSNASQTSILTHPEGTQLWANARVAVCRLILLMGRSKSLLAHIFTREAGSDCCIRECVHLEPQAGMRFAVNSMYLKRKAN